MAKASSNDILGLGEPLRSGQGAIGQFWNPIKPEREPDAAWLKPAPTTFWAWRRCFKSEDGGFERKQRSTPTVLPGAALPWPRRGRVGGYLRGSILQIRTTFFFGGWTFSMFSYMGHWEEKYRVWVKVKYYNRIDEELELPLDILDAWQRLHASTWWLSLVQWSYFDLFGAPIVRKGGFRTIPHCMFLFWVTTGSGWFKRWSQRTACHRQRLVCLHSFASPNSRRSGHPCVSPKHHPSGGSLKVVPWTSSLTS